MANGDGAGNDNPNNASGNGGGAGDQNSGGGGGNDQNPFLSALNEDNRQYVASKGWRSPDDILGSYRNLERHNSSRQDSNKSGQQSNGFDDTVKSPADYKFQKPADFPQNAVYDGNFAEAFKSWAYEAKLSPQAAQTIHDKYVSQFAESYGRLSQEREAKVESAITSTFDALTKSFGSPDTPGFKRNMELARRAINHLDPDLRAGLKEAGVIVEKNGEEVLTNAAVAKAMASVGAKIYAEDGLYGAPSSTENPFDTKKPNLTAQGKILKENPELARTLIQAAGVEKDWAWMFKRQK